MTIDKNTHKLAMQAARRLTGRDVDIQHRAPAIANRSGQALKVEGKAVIQVDPEAKDWLFVYLHELSHILHHWDILPGALLANTPPGGKVLIWPVSKNDPKIELQEKQANDQARAWLAEARGNTLAEKLESLSEDPKMRATIQSAVERGVKLALENYTKGRNP